MLILLPIVVVNVRRANAILHHFKLRFYARAHVRMAHIEAIVQIQVSGPKKMIQPLARRSSMILGKIQGRLRHG